MYHNTVRQMTNEDNCKPSEEAVLDKLVKQRVSDAVDGSPQFFKAGKRKLDSMVRDLGLPAYFLTITMNETGPTRSKEYSVVQEFMQTWHPTFDWRDAPLECNRLFLARFEHVLNNHLLLPDGPLGTVTDYAIRYECQGRVSLHVHMCVCGWTVTQMRSVGKSSATFLPRMTTACGQQEHPCIR